VNLSFYSVDAIPNATVDLSIHNELHKRMQLAIQINDLEHRRQKSNYEKNWLQELAEKSELLSESDHSHDSDQGVGQLESAKMRGLKAQLNVMLATPLVTLKMRKEFFGGQQGMANQLSALLKEE
jgi:ATP-dependent RNA helicase DDX24/MAK5